MEDLLARYKERKPEIVFEWTDPETTARGWVVIDSLRNGAAGGGTRMREGLSKEEVVSLSKVMGIKFSISGPDIGGAKSGIDFDPQDPRKDEVLRRWFKAVIPLLKNYYGTGGDLNVDELKDVVPITEALGLWHPQEGIVNGHFHSAPGEKIKIVGQLRYGCAKVVEDPRFVPEGPRKYAVADLITGYGVAESVRHYYDLFHRRDLQGKRAVIQGWGNVASAAACYLAVHGVKIVGIIDRHGGLIKEGGMSLEEVKFLFNEKRGNKLHSEPLLPFEEVNERLWGLGAEIFIPGAASKIVTRPQVDRLIQGGLEVIACGANVPFIDDEIFFGPTATYTDANTSLIPDFIANCGMARVFAYLMQPEVEMTDEAIFSDVSLTVRKALEKVMKSDPNPLKIASRALEMSLKKLVEPKSHPAI
ncbi:MAG: Glu/Leu/Phe/Val dehydrogenase [Saprospirales bacterium]|nr:Glu/Leu/Phe/Val dehydrogenase [Saprospirales bacterium]